MNEELDQNGVMYEKFVKNFMMNATIYPMVVMDLSIDKKWWMEQFANVATNNGWKNLQMGMNLGC